ncbi:TonB-dependent receptor [Novosphingobium sediminicola]|uniref:Iron complex outermembrane receptor protein n=1 Tax=Novosphingobium sediminicola TaxID=563162 RepID=A0A7W6CBP9_9SPHN|nr:TonB-dependent receptor [Novosphingobium sediminicola]MBB3953624.1 iron complex outermembrane receptor protein [Novosphingobium sediminicola]
MKSKLSSLLCLPLLAVGSAPALAQQAADSGTAGEIVVTAQKRSESLHSVPVAVSVLTGAALAATARPSIESATQLVPALNFQKSGTTLNQTIYLRGVGTATFSIAGEPSVSTVVDGVVYARSGEAFSDLVDIAQMEVLRGPQGTLFGKNASAGVITITSQMPKNEFSGSIEANYFEGNEWRVKGAINVPLGKDLAARFTGFASGYDGNIRNMATQSMVNGYDHVGGRAQFLYNPGTGVKIYVAADYHRNNDNCCADIIATGALTGAGAPTTSLAFNALPTPMGAKTGFINQNLVTSTKEDGWGISGQADIDVGTHTLTSITAYREWNNTEIRDGDWLDRAYVGFNQLHDTGPQKSNTFSQELRLTSPAGNRLSYVLGAYYSRAFSERIFTRSDEVCTATATAPTGVLIPCGSANANASTLPSATADFGSTFNNLAVFGQATFKLADHIRLVGGLRYTHDKLDVFHSRRTTLTGPGINGNFDQGVFDAYNALIAGGSTASAAASAAVTSSNGVPFRTGTSKDNLSGKAVIQADLSRDVMAYASYARGYKGPAYNIFFNLTATGTNVISPETSDAFEVGVKNTLFGGRLTLNLAGFYAKYHNFQANNPDLVAGVVVTRFTNAGDVSTQGVEADMSWRLGPDTTLGGGLAYTDAHVVNFYAAPGAASTAIIPAGTPLAYAPKWKGSLSLDHRVRTEGWADLVFGASGNFQSSQLSLFSADPVQRQFGTIPAYGLVNIQAGLVSPSDKWRIVAQVRNLFDQAYAASIINGGPGGSYRYQIPRDAMRYFGISARYNF